MRIRENPFFPAEINTLARELGVLWRELAYITNRRIYSNTATLNFGSIASGDIAELTMTVEGATIGDSVALGAPAALEAGLTFAGFVSATNTVSIRVHNRNGFGSVDPASAVWRATVIKF